MSVTTTDTASLGSAVLGADVAGGSDALPDICATLPHDIAVAFLDVFDAGMGLGAVLFAAGWLMGGGVDTLVFSFIRIYRFIKSKRRSA